MNMCGIYEIFNEVNNKRFIECSKNLRYMINKCRRNLQNNIHKNKMLQHDWNVHQEHHFKFRVLEFVDDVKQLDAKHQQYINDYDQLMLYN